MSKASLEYAVPGKRFAVEGGLRLHELEGGTEVTLSKATQGDWKRGESLSRNAMERGTSWSQQLEGNFVERTPVFYGHQTLSFTVWYADKCTRVLLYVVQ